MLASLLNGGSLSLAVISLLASTAAADVFESLPGIPDGMSPFLDNTFVNKAEANYTLLRRMALQSHTVCEPTH